MPPRARHDRSSTSASASWGTPWHRSVSESSAGMSHDELLRETLDVFGGKRLTAGITARLDSGVQAALRDGRLRERSPRFYVAA